jgi:AraC family transcriptional regulator of adaptative response / DNA-3-methyladenine glycosylase II
MQVISTDHRSKYYQIIQRRDERYDDKFFFAVKTTGIYCRPSCPARRPLLENCLFFPNVQATEAAGFRPCKRCKPDRPKGEPVQPILDRMMAGELSDNESIQGLATDVGLSARHLRRLIKHRTDTTPFRLDQARHLRYAKELLITTDLSVIEVAFRSDFRSVRQFNHSFKRTYGLSPRDLRKSIASDLQGES